MGERAYPALCKELINIADKPGHEYVASRIIGIFVSGSGDKTVPREMIQELVKKLDSSTRNGYIIRMSSAIALEKIGTKEDVPVLLALLDDHTCYRSLKALERVGDESAMPKIEAWLAKRRASLGKEKSEKDLAIQEAEKAITAIQIRSKASPKTPEVTGSSAESKPK